MSIQKLSRPQKSTFQSPKAKSLRLPNANADLTLMAGPTLCMSILHFFRMLYLLDTSSLPYRTLSPSIHGVACPSRVRVGELCPLLIFLPLRLRLRIPLDCPIHLRIQRELLAFRGLGRRFGPVTIAIRLCRRKRGESCLPPTGDYVPSPSLFLEVFVDAHSR